MLTSKEIAKLAGDDLNKYFTDTFIRASVPEAGIEEQWAYFRESGRDGFAYLNFSAYKSSTTVPVSIKNLMIVPEFPSSGLYDFGGQPWLFRRRPNRSTLKGIHRETAEFKPILPNLENIEHIREEFKPSIKNISIFFQATQREDLSKAFQEVTKLRRKGVSLTPNFAITLGLQGDFPWIWYKDIQTAVMPSPTVIDVTNPRFTQEIIDVFGKHREIEIKENTKAAPTPRKKGKPENYELDVGLNQLLARARPQAAPFNFVVGAAPQGVQNNMMEQANGGVDPGADPIMGPNLANWNGRSDPIVSERNRQEHDYWTNLARRYVEVIGPGHEQLPGILGVWKRLEVNEDGDPVDPVGRWDRALTGRDNIQRLYRRVA